MNILTKNALAIALGGIVGGLTAYLVVDTIIKARENWAGELEPPYDWVPEESTADSPIAMDAVRAMKDYNNYSKDKGDLSKLVEQYAQTEKEIRIVSADEVVDAHGRHFVEVKYYDGDNVYALENDSSIDNPLELFIPNAHLHFGEAADSDPDILYIRNDKNGTDYEITRVHAKYSVVVLGEVEPTKKPRAAARRSRTRKIDEVTDADRDDDKEE